MGAYTLSQNEKNRISVDIYGQSYSIVGSESTSHIRLVASMVDDKMREISSKNPSLDTSKLAVLTAVNAVHDYLKLKEEIEELENELKKLKD
ncbi:cell division protein ZapA [Jeotgalibacillus sp. ET6]|uniref:cell division protein ZapA n=1 Tax=Jeotgalibacillus sp. ET6 TaxID=3037260 RepID=UPI003FA59410